MRHRNVICFLSSLKWQKHRSAQVRTHWHYICSFVCWLFNVQCSMFACIRNFHSKKGKEKKTSTHTHKHTEMTNAHLIYFPYINDTSDWQRKCQNVRGLWLAYKFVITMLMSSIDGITHLTALAPMKRYVCIKNVLFLVIHLISHSVQDTPPRWHFHVWFTNRFTATFDVLPLNLCSSFY